METKKLTEKDLMIGDFVRFDMSVSHNNPEGDGKWINCIVGGIGGPAFGGTTRFIYLYDVKRKSKIGEFDFVRSLDELSPIPLTAEILEKNGFEKHYCEDVIIYKNPYPITIEMGINYNLFDDGHFFVRGLSHRLYFIHQLQQALRLLNIDKEIVP